MMSKLQDVPEERRCGAKTRNGGTCKNWGMRPSGRCRMHGGESRGGIASPTLKHGWFSRYWPYTSMKARVLAQEALAKRVAARMEVIRAEQAKKDAREQARQRELDEQWRRDAGASLIALIELDDRTRRERRDTSD